MDTDYKTSSIPFIGVSIIVCLKFICQGSPEKGIIHTPRESESAGEVYPYVYIVSIAY